MATTAPAMKAAATALWTFEPSAEELPALGRILELLRGPGEAKLVGPGGEAIVLTPLAYEALRTVLVCLARGEAISLVPAHTMLSTNEAADFLNVSRPFLIKLLERNEIPYEMVGTHRRVAFRDLMTYRERRRHGRAEAVQELADLSQLQTGDPTGPYPERSAS